MALDLWSKSDRTEANAANASGDGTLRAAKGSRKAADKPEQAPEVDPEAQTIADRAWSLAASKGSAEQLKNEAYEPARKKRILRAKVQHPSSGKLAYLSDVITEAKQAIEMLGDGE